MQKKKISHMSFSNIYKVIYNVKPVVGIPYTEYKIFIYKTPKVTN